jgi:hypothetical protein
MNYKTLDDDACDTLRSALAQGVVDPLIKLPDIDPRIFRHLEEARALGAGTPGPTAAQANPLQNPRSRRYHEHTYYPPIGQAVQPGGGWQSMFCELARIAIPDGQIGYLRRIDQILQDIALYKQTWDWMALPCWFFNAGITWYQEPEIDDCRWLLRIEQFDGRQPPQLVLNNVLFDESILPGAPYGELPEWRGFWQRAENPRDFWSIVPGGSLLRFFVWVPETVKYHWYAQGRLTAQTQSAYCPEAEMAARLGWNR